MIADQAAGGVIPGAKLANEGVRDSGGAGGTARRFVRDAEQRERGVGERAGERVGVALRVRRVAQRGRRRVAVAGDN
ncbi:MAG: hypothetical protein IT564_07175 [Rhodospirillales bacterium]|nr:hypothetical protein [Rhodospirillales bacterium]